MEHNLRRLGDLGNFEVAPGEPDVRGWDVKTRDGGDIGEVEELIVDPAAHKVRYLEVELDRTHFGFAETRRVSIPVETAEINRDDKSVLLRGTSDQAVSSFPPSEYDTGAVRSGPEQMRGRESGATSGAPTGADQVRMSRAEEELRVGTRREQVGEVVVGKRVETERVSEPVTVERERVHVERRPVEGDARNMEARIEGKEIRVPVIEEEVVVEKRPVVKEELVVSKETVQETERVEGEVRKEKFDIRKEGRVDEEDDASTRRPRRGGE